MNYWLFKSEPSNWSWTDQLNKGDDGEGWDGVRNYQASNNMKKMKKDDLGFFYHSVKEKRIVGIIKVIKEYHPDPTDISNKFGMVTVKAVKTLKKSVSLSDIKQNNSLSDFIMLKQNRLSVLPVTSIQWKIICDMAQVKFF
jgi:predicted RNA-binding protein with PUA-like domain